MVLGIEQRDREGDREGDRDLRKGMKPSSYPKGYSEDASVMETGKPDDRKCYEEVGEKFHKAEAEGGWGHPRKPCSMFAIINKLWPEEICTGVDMRDLILYLHRTWREPNVWGRARIELRRIVADRAEQRADMQRRMDGEAAKRLTEQLGDYFAKKQTS